MKIITLLLLLGCLLYSADVTAARAEDHGAALLIKDIKTKGGKAVLDELTASNDWDKLFKVCNKIGTGEKEWLELARLLFLDSDAGVSESLESSVSGALPKAPRQVLELIYRTRNDAGPKFTVEAVCASRFIEAEPGVEERHLLDSEKALELLDTSDNRNLDGLRLQCLKSIESSFAWLPIRYRKHRQQPRLFRLTGNPEGAEEGKEHHEDEIQRAQEILRQGPIL